MSEVRFGSFIHMYLHKQAVEDGVILDLQYEGRDVEQRISDKDKLDDKLATYLIENKRAVAVIEDTETEKPKATRKKTKKVVD